MSILGTALSVVAELKDPSTVNTFLVVVMSLSHLKMVLRAWEHRLLSPEPMLREQKK
jgi:hypothetical protein